MISEILKIIPSHRERPLTRATLTERIAQSLNTSQERADAALHVALDLMRLMDLIQESDDHIALSGQTQNYCRHSLIWYLENNQAILSNWDRDGTARDDISIANLLEQAPYFLKALEIRRRELTLRQGNLQLVPTREQPCSVVLFKAVHDGKIYLLHQWDQKAERYQLIGGKQRSSETPEQTASREAIEEVPKANLVLGKSLFINRTTLDPIEEWDVSRTYGALTRYLITVFQATLSTATFFTSESDLWISLPEVIAGETLAQAQISSLGATIERKRPGFFENLPPSAAFTQPLQLSKPTAPANIKNAHHDSEPEIPAHLSLNWLWSLLKRLALHELALLLGVVITLIGGAFSVGRFYEAHFGHDVQTPTEARPKPAPTPSPPQTKRNGSLGPAAATMIRPLSPRTNQSGRDRS